MPTDTSIDIAKRRMQYFIRYSVIVLENELMDGDEKVLENPSSPWKARRSIAIRSDSGGAETS